MVLAWVYGAAIAIVHFIGEELDDVPLMHRPQVAPFATGVTVAYVFLALLPEHHGGVAHLGEFGYLFGLAGFSGIHLTKKHFQRSDRHYDELLHDYKEMHSVFLFLYYTAIGILLHTLVARSTVAGTLLFVPVLLHTAISSLSLTELHEDVLDVLWVKAAISLAVLGGVAIGALDLLSMKAFHAVLGLVTGMFLYVVIHDAMPRGRDTAPMSYLAGTVLYAAVIAATWLV